MSPKKETKNIKYEQKSKTNLTLDQHCKKKLTYLDQGRGKKEEKRQNLHLIKSKMFQTFTLKVIWILKKNLS